MRRRVISLVRSVCERSQDSKRCDARCVCTWRHSRVGRWDEDAGREGDGTGWRKWRVNLCGAV